MYVSRRTDSKLTRAHTPHLLAPLRSEESIIGGRIGALFCPWGSLPSVPFTFVRGGGKRVTNIWLDENNHCIESQQHTTRGNDV